MAKKPCKHGRKLSGGCKKKPGPKRSGGSRSGGKSAFRKAFAKFQPYRKAEIAKFKRAHGHKPRTVEEYIKINKAAGRKYRAENK